MILLLKFVRWVLTALAALLAIYTLTTDGVIGLVISMLPIAFFVGLLWVVPLLFRKPRPKPKQHTDFNPSIAHDNIALDTGRNLLWIRDPKRGNRYLTRAEVLTIKTNHDWNDGTFQQRIEFQITDIELPNWQVLFQRHSDRWKTSSKLNGAERDEWFARLRAWIQQAPSGAADQAPAADHQYTLPELHTAYRQAGSEEARQNWLVAFDINCYAQGLDANKAWQRLGGLYPGPSPDLLRMQRR